MSTTITRDRCGAVVVLCSFLLMLVASTSVAFADDPDDSSASMSTLPVDDDVAWCTVLLGHRPFAAADVNLRKLVTRVDLPNGDVRLSVQVIAHTPSVMLPSTLTDCVWADLNNDQRYQANEPTSLVLLVNPTWEAKGDDSWTLQFDHVVSRGDGATVCDRISGVSVDRTDEGGSTDAASEIAASDLRSGGHDDPDRREVAGRIDHELRDNHPHILRSNRACSPRLDTPVSEAPFAALLSVAGVATVAFAGFRVRRRDPGRR